MLQTQLLPLPTLAMGPSRAFRCAGGTGPMSVRDEYHWHIWWRKETLARAQYGVAPHHRGGGGLGALRAPRRGGLRHRAAGSPPGEEPANSAHS